MAKTLFYTLVLSGMTAEEAYAECANQNVFDCRELEELLSHIESNLFEAM